MKRRFLLLTLLSLMLVYCSPKENLTEKFKADITAYTEAYNKGEWNKVADMMYPKLFTVSSREELLTTMKSLDSMGMKTTITLNSIDNVSEEFISGGEKFRMISYHTTLDISIDKGMIDKLEILRGGLETQFGKENVKFDPKLNKFNINSAQKMLAISPKDKEEWKYIEHDAAQPDYITKLIIPEDVLKKFSK